MSRSHQSRLEAEIIDYRQKLERFNLAEQHYEEFYRAWARAVCERVARTEWVALWVRFKVAELGRLNGTDFEKFLQLLFVKMGFTAELTPGSGDQGADLRVWRSAVGTIAIQAKRHSKPVGNGAIQELLGGMLYYGCTRGIVVTTSTFTRSAVKLAAKDSRITLWDRTKLAELCTEHLADPPPFSWEEYHRIKNALSQPSHPTPPPARRPRH